jgi:hypothetical protein
VRRRDFLTGSLLAVGRGLALNAYIQTPLVYRDWLYRGAQRMVFSNAMTLKPVSLHYPQRGVVAWPGFRLALSADGKQRIFRRKYCLPAKVDIKLETSN